MAMKIRSIRATDAEWDFLKNCLASYRAGNGKIEDISQTPAPQPVPVPRERIGISPDEFLKKNGLPPLNTGAADCPAPTDEGEKDLSAWRTDATMVELDRAVNYEIDNLGYPEIAETVSRQFPKLWVSANKAKAANRTAEYNEIMTELWEKLNGK